MNKLIVTFLLVITIIIGQAQITNQPLGINSEAPEIIGIDHLGHEVSSSEILESSDYIVLIFYRGSWCGYCSKHLSELQENLQLLLDKNATVIAITPEKNESIAKIVSESGATFSILHDEDYSIMKSYQVDYTINKQTVTKFYGPVVSRTAKANGNDDGILPIPATYIIGKDGLIKWVHFDPNYSERSTVEDILKVLE